MKSNYITEKKEKLVATPWDGSKRALFFKQALAYSHTPVGMWQVLEGKAVKIGRCLGYSLDATLMFMSGFP